MLKTSSADSLVFSCLSGYNLYRAGKSKGLTHLASGTDMELRLQENLETADIERKWRYFIENPINIRNVLWPVDIVKTEEGTTGLIFRRRAFPQMEPLKSLLYNAGTLDWERKEIRTVIRNLLLTVARIHEGGYAYHAFNIERIFYNKDSGAVLFDFSLAMARHYGDAALTQEVTPSEVQIDFLPPWVSPDQRNSMALLDDYYAIAALLFRLMVGRMPYQGRLMDGHGNLMDPVRDTDAEEHLRMLEYYHTIPIFIFDPEDNRNAIGLFSHEERDAVRWRRLPEKIQSMFLSCFSKEMLTAAYPDKALYSADEWLAALTDAEIIEAGITGEGEA